MTSPHIVDCPNCGEKQDICGRYTSPANRELDQRQWAEEHLTGNCVADGATQEDANTASTPEERFNELKDRLIAATGSPGPTSFHDSRVHMTLSEWERLITCIEASERTVEQTRELRLPEPLPLTEEQISANTHAVLDTIRRSCRAMGRGVGYRVPGDHNTWNSYHEGKHDFAGEIEELLDRTDAPPVFAQDRISAALNRAADKVCALAPQDERLGDGINLVVNAALHILEFPDADLEDVVEANYGEDVDTVLGWVCGGH